MAVKVIEHMQHTSRLDIARESILSTHISHPNCVNTHGSPDMLHAECTHIIPFRSHSRALTCCLPFSCVGLEPDLSFHSAYPTA